MSLQVKRHALYDLGQVGYLGAEFLDPLLIFFALLLKLFYRFLVVLYIAG